MFDWRVMVAMFLAIVLWASAFTGIRIGLTGYGAIELATLRYLVASAILVVVALLTRMSLPRWRDWPALFALGGVGFTLYNVALNAGEQSVSAGVASFVISSEVAVIAVLAAMLLGERIGRRGWAGVALCLMGVGLIALTNVGAPVPGQSEAEASGASPLLGALLVFIATLGISLYSVLQKPLFRRYNALQLTTCCIWTGTILLFVTAPQTPGRIAEAAPAATMAAVYMGIFPGIVAYVAWTYVLSRVPASRAGSLLSIIPIVSLLIAAVTLGELPSLPALVGGAIVLSGVVLVNRVQATPQVSLQSD